MKQDSWVSPWGHRPAIAVVASGGPAGFLAAEDSTSLAPGSDVHAPSAAGKRRIKVLIVFPPLFIF